MLCNISHALVHPKVPPMILRRAPGHINPSEAFKSILVEDVGRASLVNQDHIYLLVITSPSNRVDACNVLLTKGDLSFWSFYIT